ncbi:hypothetical protein [Paenibacillus tengchongensis]|uniref:hypothetical protein n=1 Tax=Paenibacillus tengchongensis TaxID=2608684 RepID=UPI00124EC523|nr:hypothetical protein [Paenibacillus tengchongensis]
MSTSFKFDVAAFQGNGDETVIRKTLAFVSREEARDEDEECYLRVAAQVEKSTSAFLNEAKYDPAALPEYRAAIISGVGVDIYALPSLDLPEWKTVLAYLGPTEFQALGLAFRALRKYREHEESVIIPALRHAYGRVDAGEARSVGEIVTYVRRAFLSEYSRIDREQTGVIRLIRRRDSGGYYSLYVTPRLPQPWRMVFDRHVEDADVPALLDRLTRRQREYVTQMHALITEDLAAGDLRSYKVDEHGHYEIRARHMARRLGTTGGSLKKLLIRAQERAG